MFLASWDEAGGAGWGGCTGVVSGVRAVVDDTSTTRERGPQVRLMGQGGSDKSGRGGCALALYVQNLDGSRRFGPRTYPHVEISSKFEVLGPRNGRGRTSSKPLKVKVVFSGVVCVKSEKIEVYYIDFSRPSPESKYGWEVH